MDLPVCALVFVCAGVCVCVSLCVVRKLPTDNSPREVLEQVCLGLVWERVEWRRACPACAQASVCTKSRGESGPDFCRRSDCRFLMDENFL